MGAEVSAEALQWYEGERAYRRQLACEIGQLLDEEQERRVSEGAHHSVSLAARQQAVHIELLRRFNAKSILAAVEAERVRRMTRDTKFDVQEGLIRKVHARRARNLMSRGLKDRMVAASKPRPAPEALVESHSQLIRRFAIGQAVLAMREEQMVRVARDQLATVLVELRSVMSRRQAIAEEQKEQKRRLKDGDNVQLASVVTKSRVQHDLLATGNVNLVARPVDVPRTVALRMRDVCHEVNNREQLRRRIEFVKSGVLQQLLRRANQKQVAVAMAREQAERTALDMWHAATEQVLRTFNQRSSLRLAEEEQDRRIANERMRSVLSDLIRRHNQEEAVAAMEEERATRIKTDKEHEVLEELRRVLARRQARRLCAAEGSKTVRWAFEEKQKVRQLMRELSLAVARKNANAAVEQERVRLIARDTMFTVCEELLRVRKGQQASRMAAAARAERQSMPPPVPSLASQISEMHTALLRAVGVRRAIEGSEQERVSRIFQEKMAEVLENLVRSVSRKLVIAKTEAERQHRIENPLCARLDVTLFRNRVHAELRAKFATNKAHPVADANQAEVKSRLHMDLFHVLAVREARRLSQEEAQVTRTRSQHEKVMVQLVRAANARCAVSAMEAEKQRRIAREAFFTVMQAVTRNANQRSALAAMGAEQDRRIAVDRMRDVLDDAMRRVASKAADKAAVLERDERVLQNEFRKVAEEVARESAKKRVAQAVAQEQEMRIARHNLSQICAQISRQKAKLSPPRFQPILQELITRRPGPTRRSKRSCRPIRITVTSVPEDSEKEESIYEIPQVSVYHAMDVEQERRVVRDRKWAVDQEVIRHCAQQRALKAQEEEQTSRIMADKFAHVLCQLERQHNQTGADALAAEEQAHRIVTNLLATVHEELVRHHNRSVVDQAVKIERTERIAAHRMASVRRQLVLTRSSLVGSDQGHSDRSSIPTMAWSNRDGIRQAIQEALQSNATAQRRARVHAELLRKVNNGSVEDLADELVHRIVYTSTRDAVCADTPSKIMSEVFTELHRVVNVQLVKELARAEQTRRITKLNMEPVLEQLHRRAIRKRLRRATFTGRQERMDLFLRRSEAQREAMAAVMNQLVDRI